MKHILGSTLLLALAAAGNAHADTIARFGASGTLQDGAVIGGSINVDTTTGSIVSSNVSFGAPDSTTQTIVSSQVANGYVNGQYAANLRNASSTEDFDFSFAAASLVGYAGGNVASGDLYNLTTSQAGSNVASMAFTAAVPEPATYWLFGAGLIAVGLRRRAAR
jgi:hypothetical protein